MEQIVVIRFRWTADELLQASCYHFRHTCRPVYRFGLHFLVGLVLFAGVLSVFVLGAEDQLPLPVGIGFLAVGIYWFAARPLGRRWWTRRQFSKRPDRDLEIEWTVCGDKIFVRSMIAQAEICWQAFSKMVCAPTGVMLYPIDQLYHWLPRHGFASDAEFQKFVELAKSKIERHYAVA